MMLCKRFDAIFSGAQKQRKLSSVCAPSGCSYAYPTPLKIAASMLPAMASRVTKSAETFSAPVDVINLLCNCPDKCLQRTFPTSLTYWKRSGQQSNRMNSHFWFHSLIVLVRFVWNRWSCHYPAGRPSRSKILFCKKYLLSFTATLEQKTEGNMASGYSKFQQHLYFLNPLTVSVRRFGLFASIKVSNLC